MNYRTEHDSMGDVKVPTDKYWGAQTQRSLENFKIGEERMPREVIRALAALKLASARANRSLCPDRMTDEKLKLIELSALEIMRGELDEHFPLSVWQTGSGTQSNMNVNEVIANRANELAGKKILHPNDDINMSQSSNDTFPSAMHICAVCEIENRLFPAIDKAMKTLLVLESENLDAYKSGRTHLEDATPITFAQEISGWRSSLMHSYELIIGTLPHIRRLAIGATAVGTGLNAPTGFDEAVCKELSLILGTEFSPEENKFHALTSKDELVTTHGALKALAADMMKIANDIRWLASGPRLGIGEITIPENEPGSSIMPGKVNPTQCEAVTMVAVRVMGNDTSIGIAASQGNFELNVFMPVLIYSFLNSVRLLSDSLISFNDNCLVGIKANKQKMKTNLYNSLMLATVLTPHIGYEATARIVKCAHEQELSLKEAAIKLGALSEEEFDKYFVPEDMV